MLCVKYRPCIQIQITYDYVEMAQSTHRDIVDQITKLKSLGVVDKITAEIKILVLAAF